MQPVVAHFYHAWAHPVPEGDERLPAGEHAWEQIVREHFEYLAQVGFDGPVIVGALAVDDAAYERLLDVVMLPDHPTAVHRIEGPWEQGTIELLHAYATEHPDHYCMYGHSKGASAPTQFNAEWRRSMTLAVNGLWKTNRNALYYGGYDAIGPYWLDKTEYGQVPNFGKVSYFGGNFWMAKGEYLAALPPVEHSDRYGPERWIGLNEPTVINQIKGWPGWNTFVDGFGEEGF